MTSRPFTYPEALGMCWGNFNSLELLLRVYLLKVSGLAQEGLGLNEGEECAETPLTDFRTFRQLAQDYNARVMSGERISDIDKIIRFRDSMAHGRAVAVSPDLSQMTVYKFSRPVGGRVRVEVRQPLTLAYLSEIMGLLRTNMGLVQGAIGRLRDA